MYNYYKKYFLHTTKQFNNKNYNFFSVNKELSYLYFLNVNLSKNTHLRALFIIFFLLNDLPDHLLTLSWGVSFADFLIFYR